jgi:hypothetical protein
VYNSTTANSFIYLSNYGDDGSGGTGLVIRKGGNVGLGGTTAPASALEVHGAMFSKRFAASTTIDWNNGNVQSLTLANGANTLTFANGQDGGKYILILKQPGSGAAGTVSWPGTVRWPSASAVSLSTTNGKTDYVGFIYNGVDSKYDGVAFTANL